MSHQEHLDFKDTSTNKRKRRLQNNQLDEVKDGVDCKFPHLDKTENMNNDDEGGDESSDAKDLGEEEGGEFYDFLFDEDQPNETEETEKVLSKMVKRRKQKKPRHRKKKPRQLKKYRKCTTCQTSTCTRTRKGRCHDCFSILCTHKHFCKRRCVCYICLANLHGAHCLGHHSHVPTRSRKTFGLPCSTHGMRRIFGSICVMCHPDLTITALKTLPSDLSIFPEYVGDFLRVENSDIVYDKFNLYMRNSHSFLQKFQGISENSMITTEGVSSANISESNSVIQGPQNIVIGIERNEYEIVFKVDVPPVLAEPVAYLNQNVDAIVNFIDSSGELRRNTKYKISLSVFCKYYKLYNEKNEIGGILHTSSNIVGQFFGPSNQEDMYELVTVLENTLHNIRQKLVGSNWIFLGVERIKLTFNCESPTPLLQESSQSKQHLKRLPGDVFTYEKAKGSDQSFSRACNDKLDECESGVVCSFYISNSLLELTVPRKCPAHERNTLVLDTFCPKCIPNITVKFAHDNFEQIPSDSLNSETLYEVKDSLVVYNKFLHNDVTSHESVFKEYKEGKVHEGIDHGDGHERNSNGKDLVAVKCEGYYDFQFDENKINETEEVTPDHLIPWSEIWNLIKGEIKNV